MQKNIDIEANLFMFILNLKEEKKKEFSFIECEKNIVYVFKSYDEFKSYFLQNGINVIDTDLLDLCRMKTTRKDSVIALKGLCDYVIRRYKMNKELTGMGLDVVEDGFSVVTNNSFSNCQQEDNDKNKSIISEKNSVVLKKTKK